MGVMLVAQTKDSAFFRTVILNGGSEEVVGMKDPVIEGDFSGYTERAMGTFTFCAFFVISRFLEQLSKKRTL